VAHLRRESLAHELTPRKSELGKRASFAGTARIGAIVKLADLTRQRLRMRLSLHSCAGLPAFALLQVQNVRDMMARVPSEVTNGPIDRFAILGMPKAALEIIIRQRT
jgi:hypothetical protein